MVVAYCEVAEEHPDNARFLRDCEQWFGKEIIKLGNSKYDNSIYEVFRKTRYIAGVAGARCTLELKKNVRIAFQRPDDIHLFGYTSEEIHRLDRLIDANNELQVEAPLIDANLSKKDCLALVEREGIPLPAMYLLGYKNNNCRGCCKSQSPAYWKKIQIDFPDMFKRMVAAEKMLNVKICKYQKDKVVHRVPLTDLPDHIEPMDDSEDIQCGAFCEFAEKIYL